MKHIPSQRSVIRLDDKIKWLKFVHWLVWQISSVTGSISLPRKNVVCYKFIIPNDKEISLKTAMAVIILYQSLQIRSSEFLLRTENILEMAIDDGACLSYLLCVGFIFRLQRNADRKLTAKPVQMWLSELNQSLVVCVVRRLHSLRATPTVWNRLASC